MRVKIIFLRTGDYMNKVYEDEYKDLLRYLYDKLHSNCIEKKYVDIYLMYLSDLEERVKNNPIKEVYEIAINDLYVMLNEVDALDHSQPDNYHLINFKNKEDENLELDKFVVDVSDNINKNDEINEINKKDIINKLYNYRENIKKLGYNIFEARIKMVAYLLMISVLLALPISTFFFIKKKNDYKTLYSTKSMTYTSLTDKNYGEGIYNGFPIAGNVFTYDNSYQEFNYVGDEGYIPKSDGYYGYDNCYYEIIEKTPWEKNGLEASRTIRMCTIPVSKIGDLITLKDIAKLFNIYGSISRKEIVLVNEIPRSDRDFYRNSLNEGKNIYEIKRYTQDLNNSVTILLDKDYTDLFMVLASELLIWLCIIEINQGPIIESVLMAIETIKNNKKITKEQYDKLDKLYNYYLSVYNPENSKKRTKK